MLVSYGDVVGNWPKYPSTLPSGQVQDRKTDVNDTGWVFRVTPFERRPFSSDASSYSNRNRERENIDKKYSAITSGLFFFLYSGVGSEERGGEGHGNIVSL